MFSLFHFFWFWCFEPFWTGSMIHQLKHPKSPEKELKLGNATE